MEKVTASRLQPGDIVVNHWGTGTKREVASIEPYGRSLRKVTFTDGHVENFSNHKRLFIESNSWLHKII